MLRPVAEAGTNTAGLASHLASTHNTDSTARTAAATVQTELTAHEATPHGGGGGVDQTARDAAATAQGEIDAHEASTHNTDAGARQGAANAQTAIEEHIPLDTVHGIPAVAARVLALENAAPAGGGPTVLFDGAFVASTEHGEITGDIVCPETGDVELYARSTSGDRPGWAGYIKMPAADLSGCNRRFWYRDCEYVD